MVRAFLGVPGNVEIGNKVQSPRFVIRVDISWGFGRLRGGERASEEGKIILVFDNRMYPLFVPDINYGIGDHASIAAG
jgi:hypothetical protein